MFITYRILIPKTTIWSPQLAESVVAALLAKNSPKFSLEFKIIGTQNGISYSIQVNDESLSAEEITALLRAFYPMVELERIRGGSKLKYPLYRRSVIFTRDSDAFFERSLSVYGLPSQDPLYLLTRMMDDLRADEAIAYTLIWTGTHTHPQKDVERMLQQTRGQAEGKVNNWFDIAVSWSMGELQRDAQLIPRYSPTDERFYRDKLSQPLHEIVPALQFDTPDKARLSLFTSAVTQIKAFSRVGERETQDNVVRSEDDWVSTHPVTRYWGWDREYRKTNSTVLWEKMEKHTLYLLPSELAAMWHLPHSGYDLHNVRWLAPGKVRMPTELRGRTTGVILGTNEYAGQRDEVRITDPERATHIHILGKIGTGKTTLLHHMIAQDIVAGKGVAVIDPQGNLVENILRTSIPTHREKDVVVLDLANTEHPPPLNILTLPAGARQNTAAMQLLSILDAIGSFKDTITVAPALRAALLTVWQGETPTIRDIVRLFQDEGYRAQLLATVENPVAQDFWEMFNRRRGEGQGQLSTPIITRLSDWYGNDYLYPMICHPDALDFASLIAERKIILVSLKVNNQEISSLDQRLLGATLLFQLQTAIMNGAARDNQYFLYIDEVHHFVTSPLDQMLAEVRQHNLSITMAHQYLKQLGGQTFDAVMGTVGTTIAFQCGIDDAQVLAPYFKPSFTKEDLIGLPQHSAATRMRLGTQTLPAFSLVTNSPVTPTDELSAAFRAKALRYLSIQRYTPKTRQEILEWLRNRYRPRSGGEGQDYDVQ